MYYCSQLLSVDSRLSFGGFGRCGFVRKSTEDPDSSKKVYIYIIYGVIIHGTCMHLCYISVPTPCRVQGLRFPQPKREGDFKIQAQRE